MKKKVLAMTMAALMAASITACGGAKTETSAADTTAAESKAEDTTAAESKSEETTAEAASEEETKAAGGKLIMVTNAEFPPY